ncbi:hypothetical protein HKCCE2091_16655 [Rhodobacterales bacterium HKCCE2091]|nr:hypothetical protein [Rhodobacterales bacterium HKCCE2091]
MENSPYESQKALADMDWEERLKKARAQREAVLRARSRDAAAEPPAPAGPEAEPPSDPGGAEAAPPTGDAGLTWEERLEKARARREAVLRAKSGKGKPSEAPPRPPWAETLVVDEPPEQAAEAETVTEDVLPAAVPRSSTRRAIQIGVGFCIGLGVGIGVMALVWTPTRESPVAGPVAEAPAAAEQAAPDAELPTSQAIAAPEAAPEGAPPEPMPEAPVVQAELGDGLLAPDIADPARVPEAAGTVETDPAEDLALHAPPPVAQPPLGDPALPTDDKTIAPFREFASALQDSVATLMPYGLDDIGTMLGRGALAPGSGPLRTTPGIGVQLREALRTTLSTGPDAAGGNSSATVPVRPALLPSLGAVPGADAPEDESGIALAGIASAPSSEPEPDPLAAAPTPDPRPVAQPNPPEMPISGAEDLALFIFAATGVGDEILDAVRARAEDFDLDVRSVNRVGYQITESQIRYYDAASAEAAERIAAEIGAISRDFTRSGIAALPGTVEIYLSGEAEVIPASRPVARDIAPPPEEPTEADDLRDRVLSSLRDAMSR